ncbi:MAG: membrane protein [Candidatus Poribacteria bacterium]|nr:MAG: membrane protein [Candidatus Poribacteria bacterium]
MIALLALVGWRLRAFDGSGAAVGGGVAFAVWVGLGLQGLALLGVFVLLGSGAARLPGRRSSGRTVRHVLANGAVPALSGGLAVCFPEQRELWQIALAGALSAALGDTIAGEVGTRWGGVPRLITNGRPVPPGENGGVTLLGTGAGLLASGLVGLLTWGLRWGVPFPVWIGGLLGNLADSLLGASVERRGLIGNAGVNLLAGGVGAGSALILQSFWPTS